MVNSQKKWKIGKSMRYNRLNNICINKRGTGITEDFGL